MGDIPIYVGGQSADVWAYQNLFELGSDGAPVLVSGVPPDAFSDTGQLWGTPLYDWKVSIRVALMSSLKRPPAMETLHSLRNSLQGGWL